MGYKILANTLFLTASNTLIKVVAFFYFWLIARTFSIEEIGFYALLITNYLFMELTSNLGIDKIVIRDMARQDGCLAGETFMLSLKVRAVAAAVSFIVFAMLYRFIFSGLWADHRLEIFIVLATVFPLVLSRNIESHFLALEKMYIPALSQLVERIILLAAACMTVLGWLNLRGFLFAFLIGSLGRAVFLTAMYPWDRRLYRCNHAAIRVWGLVREALKMAAVEAMTIVYFRIDIIMLSKMTDLESTGVYQVAYKIFECFIALFAGFLVAVFPKISREGDRFTLMRYLWLGALGLVVIAAPVIWLRETALSLFHPKFVEGGAVLILLMMTLPVVYWNSMLASFALAVNRIGLLVRIVVVLVLLNIGLNLVLIPRLSINGAAVATLVCELVSGVLLIFGLRDEIRRGKASAQAVQGQEAA